MRIKKKKILIVLEELKRGGSETGAIQLSISLKENGYEVGVAAEPGPLISRLESAGIEYHALPRNSKVLHLKRIIIKEKYSVIHCYVWTLKTLSLCSLAAPNDVPIVCTLTRMGLDVKKASRMANWIILLSGAMFSIELLESPRFSIIPISIDTEQFQLNELQSTRPDKIVVTYAGRFDEKKKIAMSVIYSIAILQSEGYNIVGIIVGSGDGEDEIISNIAHVNQASGNKICEYFKWNDQIHTTYQQSDIVVGSGQVAAEALASGCNVIVFGTGGYMGHITSSNIDLAIYTSFGDHNLENRIPVVLLDDLRSIIKNQLDGIDNRSLVHPKLSFDNITKLIADCYENVSR